MTNEVTVGHAEEKMDNLYALVKKFLEEKELKFEESSSGDSFMVGGNFRKCRDISLYISVQGPVIIMFAEYNEIIPDEKLSKILEFCARVNIRLRFTKIELDFNDNHLGVHVANMVPRNIDSENLDVILYTLMKYVFETMNDCHDSVMKILYGDITAESAYQIWLNEAGNDKQN